MGLLATVQSVDHASDNMVESSISKASTLTDVTVVKLKKYADVVP